MTGWLIFINLQEIGMQLVFTLMLAEYTVASRKRAQYQISAHPHILP